MASEAGLRRKSMESWTVFLNGIRYDLRPPLV